MKTLFFFLLLLCASCGYRFDPSDEEVHATRTITVPYVRGDEEGQLTSALIYALSSSGQFRYVRSGGDLILNVGIASDGDERIGYRYDRHGPQSKRRHRLQPVENRRLMAVEISLIDNNTNEILIEPMRVTAAVDYDYVDPNSLRDLTVETAGGGVQKSITFSLGQLDSIEGAHDSSSTLLYRVLSQKIVDGLIDYDNRKSHIPRTP